MEDSELAKRIHVASEAAMTRAAVGFVRDSAREEHGFARSGMNAPKCLVETRDDPTE